MCIRDRYAKGLLRWPLQIVEREGRSDQKSLVIAHELLRGIFGDMGIGFSRNVSCALLMQPACHRF